MDDRGVKGKITFADLDTFHGLVEHGTSAFFDEFVALNTEIDYLCSLHTEGDEISRHIVDDVPGRLREREM